MPPKRQGHKLQTKKPTQMCRKLTSFQSKSSKKVVKNQHVTEEQTSTSTNPEFLSESCNELFRDTDELNVHQTAVHSKQYYTQPYKCMLCSCTFGMEHTLRIHQLWHSGEKVYQCGLCYHRFESISNLTKHQKIHALPKNHLCFICGKTFRQRKYFIKHLNCHSGNESVKKYKCEFCGRYFNRQLSRHMLRHKDRKYECHICNKFFLRRSELQYHHQVHIQDSLEVDVETLTSYKCLFCEASLKLSKLKAHLQLHIGGLIQCRECEEVFSDSALFEQHLEKHKQNSEKEMNSVV